SFQKHAFSSGIGPLTPIHLAGGGGRPDEKKLDCRALLALRQLIRLAERGCRPSISTSKDLLKSAMDDHLRESVGVAKTLGPILAKTLVVASLHLVACNAVQRRPMQCNEVQCSATTCNALVTIPLR